MGLRKGPDAILDSAMLILELTNWIVGESGAGARGENRGDGGDELRPARILRATKRRPGDASPPGRWYYGLVKCCVTSVLKMPKAAPTIAVIRTSQILSALRFQKVPWCCRTKLKPVGWGRAV